MLQKPKMNSWDDCSDVFALHIGTNKFHSKKNKSNPFIQKINWSFCRAFSFDIIQNFQPMNPSVMKSFINHQYFLNRGKEMDY